jgi:DNA adenine methylase
VAASSPALPDENEGVIGVKNMALMCEEIAELKPRPFVKWVGGKRQLMPQILRHVPKSFGRYFEPFVGGGALFFDRAPASAVLGDANARLVATYRGVRDLPDSVIARLREMPNDPSFFLSTRAQNIDGRPDDEIAAWFIFLNKTGFNGLYRVNSRNVFNAPFGRYKNPLICDPENLRVCSTALRRAELVCGDFEAIVAQARKGDFVYFDPPYAPLSATSSFTSYTSDGFGPNGQERLRDVALRLKRIGVSVLISNSAAPLVRDLYRKGFKQIEVKATRMINCKGDSRGAITELLIRLRTMAGTATAVSSGDALVKEVAALGRHLGLEATEQFRCGRRIWGAERRIDVILTAQPPAVRRLGVECKFQGTTGSAEEKIPTTIADIAAWPIPGIVVFSGDGFSTNMRSFLIASGKAVEVADLEPWLRLFFGLELR